MILRIISKHHSVSEDTLWYWIMELDRGDGVCMSENSCSMRGGYSRKHTAIRSAFRFMERYLGSGLCVNIVDGFEGRHIGGQNLY